MMRSEYHGTSHELSSPIVYKVLYVNAILHAISIPYGEKKLLDFLQGHFITSHGAP